MDMKEQRFGIEIEMTGLSRQRAAQVLSEYFGRPTSFDGGYYGEYSVLDSQSRRWKVMSDGSIKTEKKEGRQLYRQITPTAWSWSVPSAAMRTSKPYRRLFASFGRLE